MQVRDDRRVNFSKFGVIHKEPAFPGAADGSGLYRCFLGSGVVKPASSATPLAPMNALVKLYCWMLLTAGAPTMASV